MKDFDYVLFELFVAILFCLFYFVILMETPYVCITTAFTSVLSRSGGRTV